MPRFWARFAIKILFIFIALISDVVPTAIGRADTYQSLSQNLGLYNSSDNVVVLNATNFKTSVYGSDHGWLVEFYNSWCGFCQRFAPTWKSLAYNILTWRDIVTVAALDCADDDNNPLCREYEIMRYPEVRYFAPNEQPGNLGVDVEKGKDMDALRQNLLNRLRKEQQELRGAKWPNITPYRSSEISNIWEGVPEAAKYYFFLFETPDSYLGAEIILDLHNVTSLIIRSVNSDNSLLCLMHKITRFPSLIAYGRDSSQTRLNMRIPTREGTRNLIREFMSSKGIEIKIRDIPDEHPGEWQKIEVPQNSNFPPKSTIEKAGDSTIKKYRNDTLYQGDLETALRFSIGHEIPAVKLIQGERMSALKNWTTVLASYFPMRRGNPMFLNTISFVVRSKDNMSGSDFANLVTSTEQEMAPVFTEKNEWIGCRGSRPEFRGYPCGLWTIFHTMTINHAEKSIEYPDIDPTQILRAVHAYVENFFGCADCAQHFVAMAKKNRIFEVRNATESVLWLWRAHNEVNERLSREKSGDPEFPKSQYPGYEHCPKCRDENGAWNETEVYSYLIKKYSYSGIRYQSSASSTNPVDSDKTKTRHERLAFLNKNVNARKFGWDFTIFDISICVVLYVTSAAILVLVCIKFAVKRSYKKKMYVHSILGKV